MHHLAAVRGFFVATIKEQIDLIRAEIDKTQKNKATNAHIGKLKAKIAQLKIKEEKATQKLSNKLFHSWKAGNR